jgi:hypothetical protein
MNEGRRRAYLEAMGFDVWLARPADPDPNRLHLEPGRGSTLLIGAGPGQCTSPLGGDIALAVGQEPVWAWPETDPGQGGEALREAVENRLFTRIIVFGEDLAGSLFDGDVPEVLVSSSVSVAPGLDELAVRGTAKQGLWRLLLDHAADTD